MPRGINLARACFVVALLVFLFLPENLTAADPVQPVEPVAEAEGTGNVLTWIAVGDTSLAVFRIEWSPDGMGRWSAFGTVAASADTLHDVQYRVQDKNPSTSSYYRVVAVRHDGSETPSHVVSVIREDTARTLRVSYDRESGVARLELDLETGGSLRLTVRNDSGQTVRTRSLIAVRGRSAIDTSLGQEAAGTYHFEVVLPDERVVSTDLTVEP